MKSPRDCDTARIIGNACGLVPVLREELREISHGPLNVLDFKGPVHARLTLFNDISHYTDRPRESRRHPSKWWEDAAG